jgi:hypothetical protein
VYTNPELRPPFFDSAGKVPTGSERVASDSRPLFCLPPVAVVRPPLPDHFPFPPKPFIINTYKSVTKQTTLTFFRINTYEKHRGEGAPSSNPQSTPLGSLSQPRIGHAPVAQAFLPVLLRSRLNVPALAKTDRSLCHRRPSNGTLLPDLLNPNRNCFPVRVYCGIIPPRRRNIRIRFQQWGGFSE